MAVNEVLAVYDMNISGQYLSTDNEVGYVCRFGTRVYKDVLKASRNNRLTLCKFSGFI